MRTFASLAEAVDFITGALDSGDPGGLADASREPLPADWVMDRLRDLNASRPLVGLYAGRDFPDELRAFKLGGHRKELGHIHIDFVRADDGWELQKIWMCR